MSNTTQEKTEPQQQPQQQQPQQKPPVLEEDDEFEDFPVEGELPNPPCTSAGAWSLKPVELSQLSA